MPANIYIGPRGVPYPDVPKIPPNIMVYMHLVAYTTLGDGSMAHVVKNRLNGKVGLFPLFRVERWAKRLNNPVDFP
jgi:hypothetical protein